MQTTNKPVVEIITGWANPPKLADLKQNYESGKIEHSVQKAKVKKWRDNFHVEGKAKPKEAKHASNVQPKLIRKQAEWRYPALTEPFLSREDIFKVEPVTHKDKAAAQQNQLVLNNQFNTKLDKVHFIDEYVRAAVDEGTVIVRVGWDTDEEEVEKEVPIFNFQEDFSGRVAQQYAALAQLRKADPERYKQIVDQTPGIEQCIEALLTTGRALIPQQVGTKKQKQMEETKNQPTVCVCDFENVIIDPSCNGDYKNAGFIIFNFETSKSDLKKKGRYKNLDAINIDAASPVSSPEYVKSQDNGNFNFTDDARKKFVATEYWGFWDIDGSGITKPIVVTWVGDVIIRMEESPFPDKGLPFVFASLMPVRRSVYGEPDGELLEDNQKIIGAITRGMIDIMGKSANGQTGMRKDFLDVTNKRKFLAGDDYEFNGTVDPRLGVFQHTYPEIPQSAYQMLVIQNGEAESFSGVKAFSSGISGEGLGDVAAGVRGALDAASKRELSILRRLAAGIVEIGRKIIAMNAVFLSEEEVVRVTDEDFVTVKRDDLPGNFDLKLSISTAEEDDKKAQELAFMLQTIGNNLDLQIVLMILSDIARLRKMPVLAKALENYKPQPNPIAEQQAELTNMLIQAQIQKELALAREHGASADLETVRVISERASAMLDVAKADSERAKVRQIHSDSDLRDLEYIEQESGVKQERDLQKISRQAEAQTNMKIVEAALKHKTEMAKAKHKN